MPDLLCHRCGRSLTPGHGNFYVVRIDAVADPTPPDFDPGESTVDIAKEWERLLEEMRAMSERELLDQVYRRLTLHLCAGCFSGWIENPAG